MVALTGSSGTGAVEHGDGQGTENRLSFLERDSGNGIGYVPYETFSETWVEDYLKGDGYGYGGKGTSIGDG